MTAPDTFVRLRTRLADRYHIERELGVGGMATVYLAHDVKHERKVAIKVLRPELGAVLGAERFVQEIKTTANLQHPNILPLFDSGEADGFLYYVMPFVDGESLRDKLDREKELGIGDAISIATSVAAALDYAHEQGVVHRDIKPENILLQRGQALVADFGIALALSAAGGARLTETGLSVGTPQYMSPEQATGEQNLDGRTDVYSLACVIYEMLAGEAPFTAPSSQGVIAKILTETPTPLRTCRETVPEHIDRAVHKGLSRHRADRFATASELARALSDPSLTLGGQETVLRRGGVTLIDRRLGVALLIAALGAGALAAQWLGRETATVRTVVRFRDRPPQSQQVVGGEGFSPSISPDGSQIAYNGATAGGERLYVRRLDELDARPVPGSEDAIRSFFSSDGRWLGFVSRGKLMKVTLPAGSPLAIADVHDEVYGADWGSDNVIVFSEGGRLMRVSAEGGVPELVAVPDTADGVTALRSPHFLPGGRDVLVTAWLGSEEATQSRLAVASLASGTVTLLGLSGMSPQYAATGHLVYGQPDGQVVAVPFDLAKLEPIGEPAELIGGVSTSIFGVNQFSVSKNGSVVYSPQVERKNELVLVDRTGAEQPLANGTGRAFQDPRFSPIGDRVSVVIGTNNEGIWLYDMDRGTLSRRTTMGGYAAWLPDGGSLSFTAARDGHQSLFKVSANGSDEPSLLYRSDHRVWESDWSPDGQWLAFREGGVGELPTLRDILVVRMGSERSLPTPLAQTRFNESMLAVSPSGKWLAYVSDETGQREVYVRPFPEGAGSVQVSIDGGVEPSWAPRGGELFYRTPTAMAVARVQVEPTFRVIEREVLFPDPYIRRDNFANYDVDPRSGRLLMIRGDTDPRELVIIVNWFEELKAKVRAR